MKTRIVDDKMVEEQAVVCSHRLPVFQKAAALGSQIQEGSPQ